MLIYFLLAGTSCLFLSGIISCKRESERMPVYGWEMTDRPSDSILARLDSMVYNYADPDSISIVASEYCNQSKKEDIYNQYHHRRLYWEGTALFMQGEYEKGDSLRRQALIDCDSSRFPHDYLVYRFTVEQPADFTDNAMRYERYSNDLQAFINYGDLANGFSRAVMLSQLMSDAGMQDRALRYAMLADSLLDVANLQIMRANNRANIASCLFNAGDTIEAVKTLSELKAYSADRDSSVYAIVDFNIFQMNGDTTALNSAWRFVCKKPELRRMRPLVAAAMVKSGSHNTYKSGNFINYLEEGSEYSYLPEEELYIKEAICNGIEAENPDLLPLALKEYEMAVDKYLKELKRGEVISAEINATINEVETHAAKKHQDSVRIFWIIIVTVIILSGVAVIILIMRINRLRQLEMLTQIEVEQNKRHQLISQKELYNTITKDGDCIVFPVSDKDSDKPEIDGKRELLSEQLFVSEFMKAYPKVGKTGRKIATYIWHGLDSVEIAKEMNIRKESVMQARWRLRRQMELLPEDDLEVAIIRILRRN